MNNLQEQQNKTRLWSLGFTWKDEDWQAQLVYAKKQSDWHKRHKTAFKKYLLLKKDTWQS